MKNRKKFLTIFSVILLIVLLAIGSKIYGETQGMVPHLDFDKTSYLKGDMVHMDFLLTGVREEDRTNSVTFLIDYDGSSFDLATGSTANDITNGYIPFTAKNDIGTGAAKSIELMYTDTRDIYIRDGEIIFSVDFRVKNTAAIGNTQFTLHKVNMLSDDDIFTVNNNNPYTVTVSITGSVSPTPAPTNLTPHMIFNNSSYAPGDLLQVDMKLTGVTEGDKTNSVTFQMDYDGDSFEPATGDPSKDIVNGYLSFNAKDDIGIGAAKSIKLLYATPSGDTPLHEDSAIFSACFRVKSTAAPGSRSFTLRKVNMLDSDSKLYNINNDNPLTVYVNIINAGDCNKDGKVDLLDLVVLSLAYGTDSGNATGKWDARVDLNNDGRVDAVDFTILKQHFLN
jgi:hypothetical protein